MLLDPFHHLLILGLGRSHIQDTIAAQFFGASLGVRTLAAARTA
jgi:hypothetical protein